jgi:hypothetical protein
MKQNIIEEIGLFDKIKMSFTKFKILKRGNEKIISI